MNKTSVRLLFLLVFLACRDEVGPGPSVDSGTLLGYDNRMFPCLASKPCSCPGGIFIVIRGTTYRFTEMPKNSSIALDGWTKFPIRAKLNWEKSKNCPQDLIVVNQIMLFQGP
jgi:hypothetical protein